MSQLPPPGWYDDPTSPVFERWWDGEQWSEQTRRKVAAPPQTQPGQLSRIGDLLSETFNTIGARWDDLLMVAVVAGVLQALAAVLLMRPVAAAIEVVGDLNTSLDIEGWGAVQTTQVVMFFVLTLAIAFVASLAHYRICWEAANDEDSSWSAALTFGLANIARLVGWGIVALLPIIGGAVLVAVISAVAGGLGGLIAIAGFGVLVWWGVTISFLPISIVARPAGTNPISSSMALVRGRWWKMFGRLIFLGLMAGLVSGAVGAILGRFTGNDLFGFVFTDLGNGNVEITKDLDGPVGFFLSNAVLFVSSITFTVLQTAGIARVAYQVWRRPDPEPQPDLGF